MRRMAKKTKEGWKNQKKPNKKEEMQTMLAESFTLAIKNFQKKKGGKKEEKEKPKVEFDLNMLDNLQMSDDSDVEEGELRNRSDDSINS